MLAQNADSVTKSLRTLYKRNDATNFNKRQ